MRFSFLLVPIVLFGFAVGAEAKDSIATSVVKIYVTHRQPDFLRPWSKRSPEEASGSGVIIEGKRILTNAHVVNYASQVYVQADQSTDRVPAKVTAIAPSIDLAIVEVDNASFYERRPPLPLADDLPAMKQTVSVYGYPMGGEQLSVTQGVVSRLEFAHVYGYTSGLRIQIDAAINPGNSGGPAISDGKIIGLVYSKFSAGENIGYLLAAEEIRLFLQDIQSGSYHGKPQLWVLTRPAENEALRAKLGLHKETGEVVSCLYGAGPDYPLQKWDVITRIGDEPIDNQGNVKVKDDLRLNHEYLLPRLAKDGRVRLTIFRDKKAREIEVPVPPEGNFVIPLLLDKYPRYFIYGPMVFMAANQRLVSAMSGTSAASKITMAQSPLLARAFDSPAFPGEEIVTLGYRLFPHKTSKGYSPAPFSVVTHVNGTAVRNLDHLVELLRDAKDEFLTFDLAGMDSPLVFRRGEMASATDDILCDESIRKQYSDDLEKVWHPKK
ncbi:MAG: trypsin-like peptidase domain-containing protein [Thermoguttaceae bacterium]